MRSTCCSTKQSRCGLSGSAFPGPTISGAYLLTGSQGDAPLTFDAALFDAQPNTLRFQIGRGKQIDFDPDEGTISRGVGRSPWTGAAVDGDDIKREAQAGRMGKMLYAEAARPRR